MKPSPYALLLVVLFVISCTSSTNRQDGLASDSVVVEDTMRSERASIEEETIEKPNEPELVNETEVLVDSTWLREFAGRPLGMNPYEYLKGILEGKEVNFDDAIINGETDIAFGNSIITVLITEAYGNVVCSADINTPEIPMMKGVTIGMPREDFLMMAGISTSLLTKKSDDNEYVEFNLYYEESTSTRTTFWFDDKSLIRVQYVFSPCIMYD